MNDSFHELYRFQVSIWLPGNNNSKSIFDRGSWVEQARCMTKQRADEVAICLSLRHPDGVQAAELVKDASGGLRWSGYKFFPESAKSLSEK